MGVPSGVGLTGISEGILGLYGCFVDSGGWCVIESETTCVGWLLYYIFGSCLGLVWDS